MESAIRERIKQVFRRKNVTVNSVCIRLGLKQKTLNNQINGTSAVGIGTILAIIGLYDDVSLEWLLTGEGEMLKENTQPDIAMGAETAESVTIPKSVLAILEAQARAIESQQLTIRSQQVSIENLSLLGKQGTADDVATARASG